MTTLNKYLFLFVLSVSLLVPSVGNAQIVDVNSVRVTDVRPASFSVVWGTTEPAEGSVNVFADPDGNTPVKDAVVVFESKDYPPAKNLGVMKVRVENLKANTSYYFQIATTLINDGGSPFLYPQTPPFIGVTTEQESVVVRNDVLVQQISIGGGRSTQGTLLIAEIDQAAYPVTGWAGDGVPDGWAAIDTNNFYDKNTHKNLDLVGGEPITFTFFGGSMGSVTTNDIVPAETNGMQPVKVAANLAGDGSGGGGGSSAPTASSSGGGGGGSACFISVLSSQ